MKGLRFMAMLLAMMVSSIQAWSYRITDNYTIETKFKINALGAGIAFAGYEGFNGNICMWQFNVGIDGTKSLFRPHDWRVGGVLLEEKSTGSVILNTTDWFVAKIVISNDGNHADTYLRRADDAEFTLIDSRSSRFENEFRYGLIGTRHDHDGNVNESASYDYFKITANETGEVLYFDDFETSDGDWKNNPTWADGTLTMEGRNLAEVRYFPNNMFMEAVDLHYTVEADMTFVNGFASIVFGLDESNGGSNYMWQISPGYSDGASSIVCNYYHLDKGNESWKAHAKGPDFPGIDALDFYDVQHHVMIEVKGNVVYTYIDGTLVDTFVQCDMTDLALLNKGKVGLRVAADNQVNHDIYVDNVKLTEYDKDGNSTVVMEEKFDGGVSRYFELTGKNATYAQIEDMGGDYSLHITCDGTVDRSAKVRLIQVDEAVCPHVYDNGICAVCGEYEEPGYDMELGAYTIGNLGQLIRFSQIVNAGELGAKGSLTADIDMEYNDSFQPIGLNNDASWKNPFGGVFYGNNHVISNLYVKTECEGGLFSRLRGGKIYNLGLENAYIESTANLRCGAIAGEHHDNAQMVNCFARGTFEFVTTNNQKNALAGEGAGGHFVNCYTTLPAICRDLPMGGTITNCYEGVTEEVAATGEICYKLGGAFRQTIGEDAYPELDQTRGVVYPMTEVGYATLYDANTAGTLSANVAVFTGVKNGSYLTLTEQNNTIPAQAAVILKGHEGFYSFTPATSAPAISGSNDLLGTSESITSSGSEYVLAKPEGEPVGFYLVEAGEKIPAGKAYLTSASGVKGFVFNGTGATGIDAVNAAQGSENGYIYNVAGQRLQKAAKGINIVDGKKILK